MAFLLKLPEASCGESSKDMEVISRFASNPRRKQLRLRCAILFKHKLLLILLGIIFCHHSIVIAENKPSESPPSLEELQKQAPADVSKFIDQAFACLHWGGEYSGDSTRQAQIEREWKKSCSPLKRKETQLKAKYRNNSKVLRIIQETKKQVEY